jgi:hypothetical protein
MFSNISGEYEGCNKANVKNPMKESCLILLVCNKT